MKRHIKILSLLIALLICGLVSTPFINDYLYRKERARLMAALEPTRGLESERALAMVEANKFLKEYEQVIGKDFILLISPHEYTFILMTGQPAAKMTIVGGRISGVRLVEWGKAP